jgi:hypothetical protein
MAETFQDYPTMAALIDSASTDDDRAKIRRAVMMCAQAMCDGCADVGATPLGFCEDNEWHHFVGYTDLSFECEASAIWKMALPEDSVYLDPETPEDTGEGKRSNP